MAKGLKGGRVRVPQDFRLGGKGKVVRVVEEHGTTPRALPVPTIPEGYSGIHRISYPDSAQFADWLRGLADDIADGRAVLMGDELDVLLRLGSDHHPDGAGGTVEVPNVNLDTGDRILRLMVRYHRPDERRIE